MKAPLPFHSPQVVRLGLLALAIGFGSLPVQSQTPGALSAKARADAFEAASTAFVAGNLAGAELALFQNNRSRPSSIDWNIECANRLIHLTLALRERGDFATANVVVARALDYVNDAKLNRFAGAKATARARVHEIAGFIYERLIGDPASAKSAFLAAQREAPASKAAQAGLNRIQSHEDQIGRLPGGKG